MTEYKAYKPQQQISSPIQPVQQIPSYEDQGVAFKGYAKKKTGSNDYILKRQDTRFYALGVNNGLVFNGTYTFATRENYLTHRFFCTGAVIQYDIGATNNVFIQLFDGETSNGRFQYLFLPSQKDSLFIDFSSSPRPFEADNILLNILTGFTGNFNIVLFGFDEEI